MKTGTSILTSALEDVAPPPLNLVFKALESKWTWIGIATVVAGVALHGMIQSHDARVQQAALANQQVTYANRNLKEVIDERRADRARSKAHTALVEKQATQDEIRNAQLDVLVHRLGGTVAGLRKYNDRLRRALERGNGRKFTRAEVNAFRAETGPPILGISALALQRILHNQNQCADAHEQDVQQYLQGELSTAESAGAP